MSNIKTNLKKGGKIYKHNEKQVVKKQPNKIQRCFRAAFFCYRGNTIFFVLTTFWVADATMTYIKSSDNRAVSSSNIISYFSF